MDRFLQLLEHLQSILPLRRRLVVRRCAMQAHGCTRLNDAETRITITVRASDTLAVQLETLAHEYGHALEYDRWGNHSDRWGRMYAKAYAAWTEWDATN